MERYVVKDGATLVCTYGSTDGKLQIPNNHGSIVKYGNEAVITDFVPEVNIPSFGICSCPSGGGVCIPLTLLPWIQEKDNLTIGKIPAVMDDSFLPCLKGGIISVKKHGQ